MLQKKYHIFNVVICFMLTMTVEANLTHNKAPSSHPIPAKSLSPPNSWEQDLIKIFGEKSSRACLGATALNKKLMGVVTENSLLINLTKKLESSKGVSPPKHDINQIDSVESFQILMNRMTGEKYILFTPVNDIDPTTNQLKIQSLVSGNYELKQALKDLKEYTKKVSFRKFTALMPLALTWRKHWILLVVSKKATNNHVDVNILDSKGYQAAIVPTTHIQTAIKDIFKEAKFHHQYMGHQGVMNNVDCGYFTTAYALYLMHGHLTKDLAAVKFS